jgi:hypothetical protein
MASATKSYAAPKNTTDTACSKWGGSLGFSMKYFREKTTFCNGAFRKVYSTLHKHLGAYLKKLKTAKIFKIG